MRQRRDGFVPWPDDVAARYVEHGYWRGEPLGQLAWRLADEHGDRIALVDESTRLSFEEVAALSDGLAMRLLDRGLGGKTILVHLPNSFEFVLLALACFRANVAPIMALPAHREVELSYLAELGDASAIVTVDGFRGFDHQALAKKVAASVPQAPEVLVLGSVEQDAVPIRDWIAPARSVSGARRELDQLAPSSRDIALFLLSGGTTGLPKLIARTHDDYEYNARQSAAVSEIDVEDAYLVVLPAAHNFPLACPGILGTLQAGARVVIATSPDAQKAFADMERERVTITSVVPAVAMRWLEWARQVGEAPASLERLQVGGARLASEVARQVQPTLGCRLQQVFGMAEGLLNYTRLDDPDEVVCETQGRPISQDDELLIVDEGDQPVVRGQMGDLLTRGPYTPRGYYRAPEHNERAFTPDGFYRTGDVVRIHESGNLVIEGRSKDLINRGGEKISAEEVENLMYRIPDVRQVAVVAAPDPTLGELVCACVVLRDPGSSISLAQIRELLENQGVARFKLPERVLVLDELPVTNVGKIDKKSLRERAADVTAEH